jgi:hypothetical protein
MPFNKKSKIKGRVSIMKTNKKVLLTKSQKKEVKKLIKKAVKQELKKQASKEKTKIWDSNKWAMFIVSLTFMLINLLKFIMDMIK